MMPNSLRINPSSSPRGSVKHARPGKTKATSRTVIMKTTSKPSRGKSLFKFQNVSRQVWKKYIHVHRYKQTDLYGAWFNDPSNAGPKKRRLFFGCHLTAYLAARAQDRAALKYKPFALDPSSIKLNFSEKDYAADEKLRKILTNNEFGELLRRESRLTYTKMEPTPCLRKFLEEEAAKGNIPAESTTDSKGILSLKNYLQDVVQKRNMGPELLPVLSERSADDDDGSEYEQPDEESEDQIPIDSNEARNAVAEKRLEREMARTALRPQPPSPLQIELPRLRSGSKLTTVTSAIPPRIVQECEPPALKWGAKRCRSNFPRPSVASGSNVTKLFSAPRTETDMYYTKTKMQNKIEKKDKKSKTREGRATTTKPTINVADSAADLQPTDTTNLDLLATTAIAQMMLEAGPSVVHEYAKP